MHCLAHLHLVVYSREPRECRVRRWDLRFNVFTLAKAKSDITITFNIVTNAACMVSSHTG